MCHVLEFSAHWWSGLEAADEALSADVQRGGCRHCGGRLDRADYPRKPRGLPAAVEDAFSKRISLCCSREGCRRRIRPPSLRFLGRRVYVAAVVVTAQMIQRLAEVPPRTERRWLSWWRTVFTASALWRVSRARLPHPVEHSELPGSLVAVFGGPTPQGVEGVLRFVSGIGSHVP